MTFERAKIFSSGMEYENFRYNYCDRCKHHVTRSDGFPALLENGGCPIEDGMEYARFNAELFPNVLLKVEENGMVLNWHYCYFFEEQEEEDDN